MKPDFSVEMDSHCLFRLPNGRQDAYESGSAVEEEMKEGTAEDENPILCRRCLQVITRPAECIEVQGLHQHTFANPAGIIYQIGCFRSAPGCGHAGPATGQWSWFAGFKWRVAICRACLSHIGWLFASSGSESFYGLILNRLAYSSGKNDS